MQPRRRPRGDPWRSTGPRRRRSSSCCSRLRSGGAPTSDCAPSRARRWAGLAPVTPAGNFTTEIFGKLARGEAVALPHFGLETLHHVHADDVAQAFVLALDQPSVAVGEAFHVVAPKALTLRGYAEAAASWFGRSANLVFFLGMTGKTVDEDGGLSHL